MTGKTEDGIPTLGGCFRLVSEQGVPLDIVVSSLEDKGFMMDWLDFYRSAVDEGWPKERTLLRLRQAVGDVYGPEWAEEWLKRMHHWVGVLEADTAG